MATFKKSDFTLARPRVKLTPAEMVRTVRDFNEMTQAQLAAASGVAQSAISAIENGSAPLGADRAEKLARALHVHPAVLMWPQWDTEVESKRRAG